ncbi:DUF456 domain-containing protein [bacterium]|nr:DUF456 domain-containing protein [bacterium]PJA75088.1 MAG: hypothetical protein CO151_07530 [bacterium CG_4_9_14_3_um_filter_65_15]
MSWELLADIGRWIGFVGWSLLLLAVSLLVYLGLGGNFIILGLALMYGLVTGFDPVGWKLLLVLAGLALAGEGLEFLVGTFYPVSKGATGRAITWAFVGGLAGAVMGQAALPLVGAVLGSFLGAFAGAVWGEYRRLKVLQPSLRLGAHVFTGKLLAMIIKHMLGLVMIILILAATKP